MLYIGNMKLRNAIFIIHYFWKQNYVSLLGFKNIGDDRSK